MYPVLDKFYNTWIWKIYSIILNLVQENLSKMRFGWLNSYLRSIINYCMYSIRNMLSFHGVWSFTEHKYQREVLWVYRQFESERGLVSCVYWQRWSDITLHSVESMLLTYNGVSIGFSSTSSSIMSNKASSLDSSDTGG